MQKAGAGIPGGCLVEQPRAAARGLGSPTTPACTTPVTARLPWLSAAQVYHAVNTIRLIAKSAETMGEAPWSRDTGGKAKVMHLANEASA